MRRTVETFLGLWGTGPYYHLDVVHCDRDRSIAVRTLIHEFTHCVIESVWMALPDGTTKSVGAESPSFSLASFSLITANEHLHTLHFQHPNFQLSLFSQPFPVSHVQPARQHILQSSLPCDPTKTFLSALFKSAGRGPCLCSAYLHLVPTI